MIHDGEAFIADVKRTVAELRTEVDLLDDSASITAIRGISERVTQELLKLDGVPNVNKQALSEAYRAKDNALSRKIAMLMARRKALIKELNLLGEKVDKQLSTLETPGSVASNTDASAIGDSSA